MDGRAGRSPAAAPCGTAPRRAGGHAVPLELIFQPEVDGATTSRKTVSPGARIFSSVTSRERAKPDWVEHFVLVSGLCPSILI